MKNKNLYYFLMMSVFLISLGHNGWRNIITNIAYEDFNFTGKEIGILQSIREIPGLLVISIVLPLMVFSELTMIKISILLLAGGIMLTGFSGTVGSLYTATLIMSAGFHYFETLEKSIILKNTSTATCSLVLGKFAAVRAVASLGVYLFIYFFSLTLGYTYTLLIVSLTILLFLFSILFQSPPMQIPEKKSRFVFNRDYSLFYVLTFLSGARRQIFVVFGNFLIVEKFGYSVADIALLFIMNQVITYFLAQKIGKLLTVVSERVILCAEYVGLLLLFIAYAHVENGYLAGALYIIDNMLFSCSIGINSYFKKIAVPHEISPTMALSFTINHIMAVLIPVLFGIVWYVISYEYVFYTAAFLAFLSLVAASRIQFLKAPATA